MGYAQATGKRARAPLDTGAPARDKESHEPSGGHEPEGGAAAGAACRAAAADDAGRGFGPGASDRTGWGADAPARVVLARLDDLLGAAGQRKTTVARLIGASRNDTFVQLSAIHTGVAELKKIFDAARTRRAQGQGTLLFVDEIHRFNRAQQDSFLPVMEDGSITLIGATTENPSFELNASLLSRARVLVFRPLGSEALEALLERAERVMGRPLPLDGEARA